MIEVGATDQMAKTTMLRNVDGTLQRTNIPLGTYHVCSKGLKAYGSFYRKNRPRVAIPGKEACLASRTQV